MRAFTGRFQAVEYRPLTDHVHVERLSVERDEHPRAFDPVDKRPKNRSLFGVVSGKVLFEMKIIVSKEHHAHQKDDGPAESARFHIHEQQVFWFSVRDMAKPVGGVKFVESLPCPAHHAGVLNGDWSALGAHLAERTIDQPEPRGSHRHADSLFDTGAGFFEREGIFRFVSSISYG